MLILTEFFWIETQGAEEGVACNILIFQSHIPQGLALTHVLGVSPEAGSMKHQ